MAIYNRGLVRAALVVALAVGLAGCGGSGKKDDRAPAAGVTVGQLAALSGSIGHPVYWAGPRAGMTYELSRTQDGRVYIRYLKHGVHVGDPHPDFLTVGTYPQHDAYATLKATAKAQGVPVLHVGGGGIAFQDKAHPTSVYLAFPGSSYQIEVYDPSSSAAKKLVVSGKIAPLKASSSAVVGAIALTRAQIEARSVQLHQPIYWAGTQAAGSYEFTRTNDGRVYVRYLPHGVSVGDPRPNYRTIGTYPRKHALATLEAAAKRTGAKTIALAGGGIAAVDKAKPTSVYLAYPGSDFEVEVYDPVPAHALQLVMSGRVARVG